MQLILEQTFPLGRFHATPWKVFPYDDPHGEWPPSPWRLVRAVLARSHQLDREIADSTEAHAELREALVRAFATSQVEWQLPSSSWRGPGLRQYHPSEFKRVPASASEPGMMAYNTTKVLDSFWVTANGNAAPITWLFDGPNWTPQVLTHLDACLARLTYFGRAEAITEIRRTEAKPTHGALVKLTSRRSGKVVPVLALQPDATLTQLEATTDAPSVKETNIPPGSRWMYAERPERPAIRPVPHRRSTRSDSSWMQFALGSRIPIGSSSTVIVTQRFRGRVLRSFVLAATLGATGDLKDAPVEVRERAMLLSGKDANGVPLSGHAHPVYFLHFDGAQASRLCVWRERPFSPEEQDVILKAAEQPISLTYESSAWTANLVPLDRLVPLPPSAGSQPAKAWISSTPYVPSRHVFDRHGKEKVGESVIDQITAELARRGYPAASVRLLEQPARWVKVHQPARTRDGATNNDKRGYTLALTFAQPQHGPIFLGHSAHFGLGLFAPAD